MTRELVLRVAFWFLLGIACAIVFHFMLYRITLPIKPFIYQAF
jgi:hypothetical protein